MKKMVFTLALLLMSLSAAVAQTSTFGAMSEADKLPMPWLVTARSIRCMLPPSRVM